MSSRTAVSRPVPAPVIVAAMEAAGVDAVVTVPDTNQRTVLEALEARGRPRLLRAATEDDVLGICAGLHLAGRRAVALVQQLGLFASVNALRGVVHDLRIPVVVLAGMYGRELDLPVESSSRSSVRMVPGVLDVLELPYTLIEGPERGGEIAGLLGGAFERGESLAILLGAPTS